MPANSSNSGHQFIAKVLRPEDAVASVDGQPVHATIYRHDTLMIFSKDWSGDFDTFVETALKQIGLDVHLDTHPDITTSEARPVKSSSRRPARGARGVPLALRLRPSTDVPPVGPVDAWRALQYVRFEAARSRPAFQERARRMSLDHILSAATTDVDYRGLPGWEGHGGDDGDGGPGRIPVKVVAAAPPPRTPDHDLLARRAVVAILDTPVGLHDWLPRRQPQIAPDWVVDQLEYDQGSPLDPPGIDLSNPLVGRVDSHLGHGTFIAGIIRQIAPEAKILSRPVMHSDGSVLESVLTTALNRLLDDVTNNVQVLDVVLLSLGYYPETPTQPVTSPLLSVLQELAEAGVTIVAAVGNDATTRECYPAGYSKPQWNVGLRSVGALNPNGTKAIFSNDDPPLSGPPLWVTDWRPGVAIVSTFPSNVDGSRTAALWQQALNRQAYDPDAFNSGFGLWQGTSFAAAVYAAERTAAVCAQLTTQAAPPQPQPQTQP